MNYKAQTTEMDGMLGYRNRGLRTIVNWTFIFFPIACIGRLVLYFQDGYPQDLVLAGIHLAFLSSTLAVRLIHNRGHLAVAARLFLGLTVVVTLTISYFIPPRLNLLLSAVVPFVSFMVLNVMAALLEEPRMSRRWGHFLTIIYFLWTSLYFLVLTSAKIQPSMIAFAVIIPGVFLLTVSRFLAYLVAALYTMTAVASDQRTKVELANLKLEKTNRELEEARDQAVLAGHSKTMFLANMSHELRTPLNAIIGYAELNEEQLIDTSHQDLLTDSRHIQRAARHLLSLIGDVLDLAKVEDETLELESKCFSLLGLVDDLDSIITRLAERNHNVFEFALADDVKEMIGDERKTRQCLINVLGNAAKFTKSGTIRLAISTQIKRGRTYVIFCISDTGIGMSKDQVRNAFLRFWLADPTSTRRFGGSGLGLAITKAYWEAMGGSIDVDSRVGKGTVFTMLLPQQIAKLAIDTHDAEETRTPS